VTTTTIAYVACAGNREIHCFNLDKDSGALALFDVVTVPGGDGPSPSNMPMALSSDGTMLFAALRMMPFAVSTFSIDAGNGTLIHRNAAPLPAPMAYISVAARDRFLMGASYKEGKLSLSAIAGEGVKANVVQVVATPPKAHCILKGKSDGVIYATTVEGNAIMVFQTDAETGWLVEGKPHLIACRPGSGPRHLALHPQLNVLYCVNELAGTLAAFAIESETGTLSEMQYETLVPPGFNGNARAADLHLTADGRFAYASVRNTNSIAGFRVDYVSGHLSRIGFFQVESSPRSFALDPDGRLLVCAGQGDNSVGVYAIDSATGALTFRHRHTVAANPSWVQTLALRDPP
jgi:6-phosphogluconolactonase